MSDQPIKHQTKPVVRGAVADFVVQNFFTDKDRQKTADIGFETGIKHWDCIPHSGKTYSVFSGFTILAGQPGAGKTSLAMSFAINAVRAGQCVLYLSYEEAAGKVGDRMYRIAETLGVPIGEQQLMLLEKGDFQMLLKAEKADVAADAEKEGKKEEQEKDDVFVSALRRCARELAGYSAGGEVPLIIIDSLHETGSGGGGTAEGRRNEITSIGSAVMELSKGRGGNACNVIAICRASRQSITDIQKSIFTYMDVPKKQGDDARKAFFHAQTSLLMASLQCAKESGDLEYQASSVLYLAKGQPINDEGKEDRVLICAKERGRGVQFAKILRGQMDVKRSVFERWRGMATLDALEEEYNFNDPDADSEEVRYGV